MGKRKQKVLTPEQAEQIMNISGNGSAQSLGVDQRENFLYTYVMIIALYMVIVLYGQMVASNVATEKSSRAMEVPTMIALSTRKYILSRKRRLPYGIS